MSEKFFTFPLCLLALPGTERARLDTIVGHALERAGASADETINDDQVERYVQRGSVKNFKRYERHVQLIKGAITCGVNIYDVAATLRESDLARDFVAGYESRHGQDALVFVGTRLLFGCRDHGDPSYRDFTTLAAVNSIIGVNNSRPVLIRRCMIQARQIGYKKPSIVATEVASRSDQKILTTQQLRDSLDRLEVDKLIARCQASRTRVFFSNRLEPEALREAVKKLMEQQRLNRVQRAREFDRRLFPSAPADNKPTENQPRTTLKEGTTQGTK